MTNSIEGAMPPLPESFDPSASHIDPSFRDGFNHCHKQFSAYAAPLIARVAELQADAARYRFALESIAEMTYDSWTNGARAKQIAETALISYKEQP